MENNNKKVKFYKKVRVILIPCLKEYEQYELLEKIWYTDSDYEIFIKNEIEFRKNKLNNDLLSSDESSSDNSYINNSNIEVEEEEEDTVWKTNENYFDDNNVNNTIWKLSEN